MAADGDCPSQFLGQPWSVWTEHLGRDSPLSDEEELEKKSQADAMRLPREDMGLFGHCPERDPFFAVVCELCSALVKPQVLRSHMDLWHKVNALDSTHIIEASEKAINRCALGPKTGAGNKSGAGNVKLKAKKSPNNAMECAVSPSQEQPCVGSILTNSDTNEEKYTVQYGGGRNQAVTAGTVSLQPVVALTPLPSPDDIATIMTLLPRLASQLISGSTSSSTITLSSVSGDQRLCNSPPKKRLKSERLPVKDREYDPDKHCGVWNEESNKPCTRALTCKTHSMSMRRAVVGRSKHFDKLLAEYRAAKEAAAGKPSKTMSIVQVTRLVGGGQLLSPINGSTSVVPAVAPAGSLPPSVQISPQIHSNSVQISSSVAQSPARPPTAPDLTVDSFEAISSFTTLPTKTPVLTTVARFTPGMCHLPRPPEEQSPEEQEMVKFVTKFDEVTWLRSHPKPVTVCAFPSRRLGGAVSNSRRVELFRQGLKTALSQGCIRIPHSNNYYRMTLHTSKNHAASTMKTVLSNLSSKGSMLSATSKLLVSNCPIFKSPRSCLVPSSASRKLNQIPASLANALVSASSLKTVLPKPTVTRVKTILNHSSSLSDTSLKNGQFLLPNILSASLKKPLQSYKPHVNSKRHSKRKNNINAAQVLGTLLARRPNHINSASKPLITVAVPNGVTLPATKSSQGEGRDVKAMFTPRSVVVPDALLTELSPKTLTSNSVSTLPDSTSSTSSVKDEKRGAKTPRLLVKRELS